MSMRISTYQQYGVTSVYYNRIQQNMAKQQLEISTGKNFYYPSDDPMAANQSLLINNSMDRLQQFQKNITDAKGFLQTGESVFSQAVQILQDAKSTGLQAASGTNAADKTTFSKIIDNDINQMVGLANTKYMDRYIFSGQKTDTPAFSYDGTTATYNGDSKNVNFNVSDSMSVQISDTGDTAFQGVLNSLIDLRNQINTGTDASVTTSLTNLDTVLSKTTDLESDYGVRLDGINTLSDTYSKTITDLTSQKSQVEDADLTKVVSDYTLSKQLYQGTIQASMKMMQTSILNYM